MNTTEQLLEGSKAVASYQQRNFGRTTIQEATFLAFLGLIEANISHHGHLNETERVDCAICTATERALIALNMERNHGQ